MFFYENNLQTIYILNTFDFLRLFDPKFSSVRQVDWKMIVFAFFITHFESFKIVRISSFAIQNKPVMISTIEQKFGQIRAFLKL